jgi:hypothetical protein
VGGRTEAEAPRGGQQLPLRDRHQESRLWAARRIVELGAVARCRCEACPDGSIEPRPVRAGEFGEGDPQVAAGVTDQGSAATDRDGLSWEEELDLPAERSSTTAPLKPKLATCWGANVPNFQRA